MSLNLTFAAKIQKVEFRQAGEKSIAEISICEKKYNKDKAAEPEYDWIRISLWEPPEFLANRLKKGNFIAGSGAFSTRKFTGKDGVEKVSMECKADSRSVTVVDAGFFGEREVQQEKAVPAPGPRRPAAAPADEADCPF